MILPVFNVCNTCKSNKMWCLTSAGVQCLRHQDVVFNVCSTCKSNKMLCGGDMWMLAMVKLCVRVRVVFSL